MKPVALPALVLTAGLGTRLHPLSCVRAKPALPVAGTPLVCRILVWLARAGVRDVVLNLHHHPSTITREVGDGSGFGVRVRYSWESRLLGTAGGPRRALPLLSASQFFLVNGDTLASVDLEAMRTRHVQSGACVTMAVMSNPDPARYGGVLVDDRGGVRGFVPAGSAEPARHFAGIQVVESAAFAGLPDGEPASTVSGLYPRLLARRPESIRTFEIQGAFRDIGTAADYLDTSLTLAHEDGLALLPAGRRAHVASSARVVRTALWNDAEVGPDCELTECIVADDVRVPAGTRLRRTAIVRAASCPPRSGDRLAGDLLFSPIDRPDGRLPAPAS